MHLHEPAKNVGDVAVVHDVGAVHHTFISASVDLDAWVGLGETVVVAGVVPVLVSRKDSLQADTLNFQECQGFMDCEKVTRIYEHEF